MLFQYSASGDILVKIGLFFVLFSILPKIWWPQRQVISREMFNYLQQMSEVNEAGFGLHFSLIKCKYTSQE